MYITVHQEAEQFLAAICTMVDTKEPDAENLSQELLDDAAELAHRVLYARASKVTQSDIEAFRNRVVYHLVTTLTHAEDQSPSDLWFIQEIERLARPN